MQLKPHRPRKDNKEMLEGKLAYYRLVIGIIIGASVAFPLGAFAAKAYFARSQFGSSVTTNSSSNNSGALLTEGFDFNSLRKSDNEWAGPNIGDKIDLTRLKTRDGKTLASMAG